MMLNDDAAELQQAFIGLLAKPLVAPSAQPDLYALVHRHLRKLEQWANRLGYVIVRVNQCYRLRRVPIAGELAIPAQRPPSRQVLVFLLYVAICLEQHREADITLQEISDALAIFAGVSARIGYDPNRRAQRRELVAAVRMLREFGVLESRTREDLQDSWERSGEGIGAGYILHRDALMLLVDTEDVERALASRVAADQDDRLARLLRRLVETQALYPQELTPDERTYLAGQRPRLVRYAQEMTGGVVEVRTDAWVLVLPNYRELPADLHVGFPDTTAVDWAALALLDAVSGEGFHQVLAPDVDTAVRRFFVAKGDRLPQALRVGPQAVRRAVEERLLEVGILRLSEDGDWLLTPAAARYRDAELVEAPPALFEEFE